VRFAAQFDIVSTRSTKRVIVNPNRATRLNSNWTVVGFEELDHALELGERVIAVQPESSGNLFSTARVEKVDAENALVYLSVAWDAFAPYTLQSHHVGQGLRTARRVSTMNPNGAYLRVSEVSAA